MYSKLKAFLIIACATLVVSGASYLIFYPLHTKKQPSCIEKIIQNQKEGLLPAGLVSLLGLKSTQPLDSYDCEEGIKKLKETHAIAQAKIIKLKPSTLFIDYTLRSPIGYVGDLVNTAVDEEGLLFPVYPFYTPKRLPEIYFGLPSLKEYWGRKLGKRKMQIVSELLHSLRGKTVTRIDLSLLDEPTLGKREIILCVKAGKYTHTLRLHPTEYLMQLENYAALEKTLFKSEKVSAIIDLRIPDCAYIKKEST